MKVATVLGTRPEIIRLSRIIALLDELCDHTLIHTGQNFDRNLSDVFFEELGVRAPDHYLDCKADSAMGQIGLILERVEKVFRELKPDRILILGDTNSALTAFVAKRMGIPVYHMEAGNRCYDDRVPEEVNRRVVDHSSDILMPYTERSRENLLREGFANNQVYVIGNPIKEVLDFYDPQVQQSSILQKLNVKSGDYFLVTLHRSENVDMPERLNGFLEALAQIATQYGKPMICSLHPRTRSRMEALPELNSTGIQFVESMGLFDFVRLEKEAYCVLSDSGTVQEECAIFNVPNVTLRDVTERPETLEAGTNMLSGGSASDVIRAVKVAVNKKHTWQAPPEYTKDIVSDTVARLVLSYRHGQ